MKHVGFLLIWGTLSYLASQFLTLNQNLISSLDRENDPTQEVLEEYHKDGFYNDLIFIESSTSLPDRLTEALDRFGYKPHQLINKEQIQALDATKLLPMISPDKWREIFDPKRLAGLAERYGKLASLPGSSGLLAEVAKDPLGIKQEIVTTLAPAQPSSNQSVMTFKRHGPLDYEKVGEIYHELLDEGLVFTGGDFFAYENYRAIKRDMHLCFTISIVLNLALFFYLCHSRTLLLYLLVGTSISYATGILLTRMFFTDIYSITLAFTSTFIGFNNEYLVHFSGIDRKRLKSSVIGLGSAIGTTLIIFILLLFSDIAIIRQMALISIGGMVGFISFMLLYQDRLQTVTYRKVNLPNIKMGFKGLLGLTAVLALGVWLIPSPSVDTSIHNFRFQSSKLTANADHFSAKLKKLSVSNPVALPIKSKEAPDTLLHALRSQGIGTPSHPLDHFRSPKDQQSSIDFFNQEISKAQANLNSQLASHNIVLPSPTYSIKSPTSSQEYLQILSSISPVPWFFKVKGTSYLVIQSNKKDPLPQGIQLNLRQHYDLVLNEVGDSMLYLFAIGTLVMLIYLVPWQQSIAKLLYIFTPLFLSGFGLYLFLWATDQPLNVIHIMGLSLVIALALDYSSIAVSSQFHSVEKSKIVLTGISSVISFGCLILANHPVLRDLGMVVGTGSLIALIFAMFDELKEPTA